MSSTISNRRRSSSRPGGVESAPRPTARLRIGIHGRLGSGNLGNDGTVEALLIHLLGAHPDAAIDFLCSGPEVMEARHSLPARQMHRLHSERRVGGWRGSMPVRAARVAWGAVADGWTTARWVREHDLVIVPGMGSLETTLPVKPWQLPAALFCVSVVGRLTAVPVAFVCVGASEMEPGPTRFLLVRSAQLARYRSFRDEYSRDQMARMGVRVARDEVYPDLAFALPEPAGSPALVPGSVGLGVMDLASGDASGDVGRAYHRLMVELVLWLVDHQRPVRLLIGDGDDTLIARAILEEVRQVRPGLPAALLEFEPAATLDELSRQLGGVETVIASRFHNVLCAVKAGKPTLSLGYAAKHRELMASVGAPEFALDPREARLAEILALLERLDSERAEVVAETEARVSRLQRELDGQFEALQILLGDGRARAVDAGDVGCE